MGQGVKAVASLATGSLFVVPAQEQELAKCNPRTSNTSSNRGYTL